MFKSIHCYCTGEFFYIPFDELLVEAELIVTGEIIEKDYVKKETLKNWSIRNPVTGQMETKSEIKMGVFTDYELHLDEIFKGSIKADIIHIEESGGCYDGICATASTGYQYEIGDQVFILLKKRADRPFYQSTRQGYTAYYLSDDGRIYKSHESLEIINGAGFERSPPPEPETLEEIEAMLNIQPIH
ncbi:hypothetical protein [Marinicella gelatinilytica]|uniref:hypothetical protein n=1 Tax=Marinicella gelatinilytica TaxID=2996017 RepID=UPI002260C0B3|nr:hypothetical protein [Marinicella gelatinilytica]MCX7546149.1 hypothetical protein [Marinicella gelatinilytica]